MSGFSRIGRFVFVHFNWRKPAAHYPPALKAAGLYFSQALIWVKEHPVLTRKDFMGNHEWCFYGWREGAAHQFFGTPNIPDVWLVKKVNPAVMKDVRSFDVRCPLAVFDLVLASVKESR